LVTREAGVLASRLIAWETLLRVPGSDEAFLSDWATVAAEVRGLASSRSVCNLLESEEGRRYQGRLAPFQRRHLLHAERAEAAELLRTPRAVDGSFGDLVQSAFALNTFDRLEETARLVDLGGCRRVVIVGCGALPAAAFFFHERTQAFRITALDVDRGAADLARLVTQRHGSERLGILCQDGRDHDYEGADVVYVVNQVKPKRDVLQRIAATAPPAVRVVLRDPFGPGRLLADSVDGPLPQPWRLVATGAVDPNFFSRHLLLSRLHHGADD
jgi:hypothetical protein